MPRNTVRWATAIFVIAFATAGYLAIRGAPLHVDEVHQLSQIEIYRSGERYMYPRLVMLPAYHVIVFGAGTVLGDFSLATLRLISLFLSLPVVWAAWLLHRGDPEPQRAVRTLQLFLMPLSFSYLFLLYTDMLSAALVLGAVFLWWQRHAVSSAGALAAGILVRTNNIMWAPFLLVADAVRDRDRGGSIPAIVGRTLRRHWMMLVLMAAFAVFVWFNGGVALGDREHHRVSGIHTGNMVLGLFWIAVVLIVPLSSSIFTGLRELLHRPWRLAGIAAVLAIICWRYQVTNYYNIHYADASLQHQLLHLFETPGGRVVLFGTVGFAALGLACMRWREKWQPWLFVFAFFYLAPSNLITYRYAFIPIFMVMCFRERLPLRVELVTLGWLLAWSIVVHCGHAAGWLVL